MLESGVLQARFLLRGGLFLGDNITCAIRQPDGQVLSKTSNVELYSMSYHQINVHPPLQFLHQSSFLSSYYYSCVHFLIQVVGLTVYETAYDYVIDILNSIVPHHVTLNMLFIM